MSTEEILTELEGRVEPTSALSPSPELIQHGLIVWDGGCAQDGDEWARARDPVYRITPAGRFTLEAWRLPPP